ncbi:MAG: hypothetical protein IPO98_08125 [Saprospiraceae bacterium]|nr:hypothetical protein [Saprospiraceae bacterium]
MQVSSPKKNQYGDLQIAGTHLLGVENAMISSGDLGQALGSIRQIHYNNVSGVHLPDLPAL